MKKNDSHAAALMHIIQEYQTAIADTGVVRHHLRGRYY